MLPFIAFFGTTLLINMYSAGASIGRSINASFVMAAEKTNTMTLAYSIYLGGGKDEGDNTNAVGFEHATDTRSNCRIGFPKDKPIKNGFNEISRAYFKKLALDVHSLLGWTIPSCCANYQYGKHFTRIDVTSGSVYTL